MDLTQRTATTDECDSAGNGHRGKNLEQVPRGVVKEENTLECDQGSEENGMRERGRLECGGEVVDIGAEEEPLKSELAGITLRLVGVSLTMPARTGIAAITRPTKASVITSGGLDAASLKMWWISAFLP